MSNISKLHGKPLSNVLRLGSRSARLQHNHRRNGQSSSPTATARPRSNWKSSLWQVVRFGIAGVCNSTIDILTLNILLWSFPTHHTNILVLYNTGTYTLGALNSYVLNKYWTFQRRQVMTGDELIRFTIVTGVGLFCNNSIFWLAAHALHPLIANAILWANISKGSAIIGTTIVSYLGMRLWVFADTSQQSGQKRVLFSIVKPDAQKQPVDAVNARAELTETANDPSQTQAQENTFRTRRSLSVILPAHNEEAVIAKTLYAVVATLIPWLQDFEVIVINDGSKDATEAIVEKIASADPHVHLITHEVNQGYGAALVSGFEAAAKDLVFFMDSDGQFDICDLKPFFPLVEKYDAVLGYRLDRQDTWMRKLNAWGWKVLIRFALGVHVRDIDCAFKLYHADFFRKHRLETRGAMINAEILYKLKRFGYTSTQQGVRHLPRRSGRATGAKLSVILRALHELGTYAWKWHREEQQEKLYGLETQP